jgi:predicted porin
MKKPVLALAACAWAGVACAQSSVTLFGVVDAAVQRISNSGGASVNRLSSNNLNYSRLGFRGVEDLGSGMSASFWLEAGLLNDDGRGLPSNSNNQLSGGALPGGLVFNRRSTVSVAGGWGEVRLGRDYTPQFWNLSVGDPFGTTGLGASQTLNAIINGAANGGFFNIPTAVRASNSLGYFMPAGLGGFYGHAMVYAGENPSNATVAAGSSVPSVATGGPAAGPGTSIADDGNGYGVRLGYASGPANIAVATGLTRYAAGNARQSNIAGSWDFGVAKIMGQVTRDSVPSITGRGWLVGGMAPVGLGEIRMSVSQYQTDAAGDPRSRKYAAGYAYNLSKRTALYTTYARVQNRGGAAMSVWPGAAGTPAANGASSGFDVGISHKF